MLENLASYLSSKGGSAAIFIWLAKFFIEKFRILGLKGIELEFALWNDL